VPPHLPQDWYDDYLTHFASCVPSPNLWTPRHRTGSHLVIHNRIDIYAKALAKRCDNDDGPGIDLKELLPWEPEIPTRTRRRRL
jgi:hypothetical protein